MKISRRGLLASLASVLIGGDRAVERAPTITDNIGPMQLPEEGGFVVPQEFHDAILHQSIDDEAYYRDGAVVYWEFDKEGRFRSFD